MATFSEFIDWNSQSVHVLLSPYLDELMKKRCAEKLKQIDLPGHLWFNTSGTMGREKFVALSKEAVLLSAKAVNKHFQITKNDRWLNVLPTFHVGGVGVFARAYLSGSKVFDLYAKKNRWSVLCFIQSLVETEATLTAVVPTQVFDIVQHGQKAPSSLRVVIVGGGMIDFTLFQEATSLGWKLYPSYGLTECSSQVATSAKSSWPPRYRILDHVDLKIDDKGYIYLKSDSLLSSYAVFNGNWVSLHDPKVDGWYKTEDKGKIEKKGLEVLGRNTNFVKVGGESVYLDQLQLRLNRLKAKDRIAEKMVLIAEKHPRLGQVISLCIEGKYSKYIETLIKKYNQSCLPFERIQSVYTVDQILISSLGKIRRGLLNCKKKVET